MSDLIERDAAIAALEDKYFSFGIYREQRAASLCIDAIKNLPSAQPERKKGRWIIKDDPKIKWYKVTCSECGEDVTSVIPLIGFFPNVKPLWDFCPECGARMEVEHDH